MVLLHKYTTGNQSFTIHPKVNLNSCSKTIMLVIFFKDYQVQYLLAICFTKLISSIPVIFSLLLRFQMITHLLCHHQNILNIKDTIICLRTSEWDNLSSCYWSVRKYTAYRWGTLYWGSWWKWISWCPSWLKKIFIT